MIYLNNYGVSVIVSLIAAINLCSYGDNLIALHRITSTPFSLKARYNAILHWHLVRFIITLPRVHYQPAISYIRFFDDFFNIGAEYL